MTDEDVSDMKAYLFSLEPLRKENREPEFDFPYNSRASVRVWRRLYFDPKRFVPRADQTDEWNRGAYISEALAHCGECHTPRTFMGASDDDMYYAGSTEGPEGELAPNITPDEATGIGKWSVPDIVWFLQTSFKPDGDDAQFDGRDHRSRLPTSPRVRLESDGGLLEVGRAYRERSQSEVAVIPLERFKRCIEMKARSSLQGSSWESP